MTGFEGSSPSSDGSAFGSSALRTMKDDPVEEPIAPAREVVHQVAFLLLGQLEVLPVLARLVHQRVVVRVVVAEDEPALPVGDVPRRHVHAFLTCHLADDPPGHVDAVREDGGRELNRSQQAASGERRRAAPTRDISGAIASPIGSPSSEPVAKNLSAPACACSPIMSPSSVYDWISLDGTRARCGRLRHGRRRSTSRCICAP